MGSSMSLRWVSMKGSIDAAASKSNVFVAPSVALVWQPGSFGIDSEVKGLVSPYAGDA